jgi:hypothetical protein
LELLQLLVAFISTLCGACTETYTFGCRSVPCFVLVVHVVAVAFAQYVIAQYLLEDGRQVSNTKHEPEMPGVTILVAPVVLWDFVVVAEQLQD